jgi:hypothetical protein
MNKETDVPAELTNRLKAYYDATLRSKMRYSSDTNITSIELSDVTYRLTAIDYDKSKEPPIEPNSLVTKEFKNDSDAVIHSQFQQSEQSTDSFKWAITEGLKIGASAKFQAGVPLIGQAEANLSTELALGASQESTVTKTHTWSETVTIDIPPKHSIKCSIVLNEVHADFPLTATVRAEGSVVYHLNKPNSDFNASLDGGVFWPTRPDLNKLSVLPDSAAHEFRAKGQFTGRVGISSHVDTSELKKV